MTTNPDTGEPVDVDEPDWTDAGAFQRAEQARLDDRVDESQVEEDLTPPPPELPTEADEADVLEQHQVVSEADEDEAPRDGLG
ncbi:MAG TPA: hypothetical protein VIK12_00865 [Pengzhenrongella sp.]